VPIDQGWSCPSVAGGEIFLTSRKLINWNTADEIVQCLDATDGHEKWRHARRSRQLHPADAVLVAVRYP